MIPLILHPMTRQEGSGRNCVGMMHLPVTDGRLGIMCLPGLAPAPPYYIYM